MIHETLGLLKEDSANGMQGRHPSRRFSGALYK